MDHSIRGLSIYGGWLLIFFCVMGCSHRGVGPYAPRFSPSQERITRDNKVIDISRLKAGGRLVVVPFHAGPSVGATPESEKVALMFVKGVSEVLMTNNSPLRIVSAQEADSADLLIKGHITDLKQPQGVKRLLFGRYRLAMEGKMVDLKTNRDVLYFSGCKDSIEKATDLKEIGFQIGIEVGHFILHNLN